MGSKSSVAGRSLLNLKELALDRPHPRHQPVQLGEEAFFVLPGLLDEIGGGAVANSVQSISQLPVQKPHSLLQIQKLLVKLMLLDHSMVSCEADGFDI